MPKTSAIILIISLLLLILFPLSILTTQLVTESISFYGTLRGTSSEDVLTTVEGALDFVGIQVESEVLSEQIDVALRSLSNAVFRIIQYLSAGLASALFQVLFTLIFIYFLLLHGKKLYQYTELFLPFSSDAKLMLKEKLRKDVRALFLGQGLIAIIQGIAGGLGFWIFGIPNPVFWGTIMAFLSVIPPFGTALIWFPASLFLVAQGNYFFAIGMFLWGLLITSNIDNIVRPYIVGQMSKLSFLTVLIGVIIGLRAFNIIGVVLGPLLISVLFVLAKIYYVEYMQKK